MLNRSRVLSALRFVDEAIEQVKKGIDAGE